MSAGRAGRRGHRAPIGPPARRAGRRTVGLGAALGAILLGLAAHPPAHRPVPVPRPAHAQVAPTPVALDVEILDAYPHDDRATTQGLLLHDGALYESTGGYGASTLRQVALETGEVVRQVALPADIWAEGLARVDDRLIQLTYVALEAYVYDLATFARRPEVLTHDRQGWGLCHDGTHLVHSDGTSRLFVRDPDTFAEVRTVSVTYRGDPLTHLNELECVGDAVYANLWLGVHTGGLRTDDIVRIDPRTGAVTGVIDASGLLTPDEQRNAPYLNGIAWDATSDTFLLTGKRWPKLFRVRLVGHDTAPTRTPAATAAPPTATPEPTEPPAPDPIHLPWTGRSR